MPMYRGSIHPTDLETFQMCPEKYWRSKDPSVKRRYVSIPLIKGTAMHRWLAKFVAPAISKNQALIGVEELREMVFAVANEYQQNEVDLPALIEELEDLETMAIKAVEYVHNHGIEIVHTELTVPYIMTWDKSYPFEGTIDVVTKHPDTPDGMVEIWDYKTGKKHPDEQINRKLQFGHYYIAAGERGMKVNRVFWAQTEDLVPYKKKSKYGNVGDPKGQFLYPVHVSRDDVITVFGWTKGIVEAIEQGIRYPAPSVLCQGCEYNDTCPRFKVGVSSASRHDAQFDNNVDKQAELEKKLMEEKE